MNKKELIAQFNHNKEMIDELIQQGIFTLNSQMANLIQENQKLEKEIQALEDEE